MEKEQKNYKEMTNDEKAQAIYNYMVNDQREALDNLIMDLSFDNSTDTIMTIEGWIDDVKEYNDIYELIQIAQQSKDLDINDDYIRTNIYYYGYATNDDVLALVDEDEAIDWIANALDNHSDLIKDIDKVMEIKFN